MAKPPTFLAWRIRDGVLAQSAGFGFLVWLIPFVVAFLIFPLKESWRSLFESIMPVTLASITVLCAVFYFRGVKDRFLREACCRRALVS